MTRKVTINFESSETLWKITKISNHNERLRNNTWLGLSCWSYPKKLREWRRDEAMDRWLKGKNRNIVIILFFLINEDMDDDDQNFNEKVDEDEDLSSVRMMRNLTRYFYITKFLFRAYSMSEASEGITWAKKHASLSSTPAEISSSSSSPTSSDQ